MGDGFQVDARRGVAGTLMAGFCASFGARIAIRAWAAFGALRLARLARFTGWAW